MRRGLIHFWRLHIGVVLGVGVACAALTGALLVGDSVRSSLRALAIERLGRIEHALVGERFFRAALADSLPGENAATILLSGSARHSKNKALANGVQIHGIDADFAALFSASGAALWQGLQEKSARRFPALVVNASLQKQLGAQLGDDILLSLPRQSTVHREALFGRRDTDELVVVLRLTLTAVVPDAGVGRFGLRPHQHMPLNGFVDLHALQRALGEEERVNALFFAADIRSIDSLQMAFYNQLSLPDLDLLLTNRDAYLNLESTRFVLNASQIAAATETAAKNGFARASFLTYLANEIAVGEKSVPYSTVTALDNMSGLQLENGGELPALGAGDIALNAWAARELNAAVGDSVLLRYYSIGPREELISREATFLLTAIVAMRGLAVDAALTPAYPGLQDVENIAAWDAPIPIDAQKVRPQDEAYWDQYGAAPKAFVSAAAGQRLWQSRFGDLTALRFYPPHSTSATYADFARALRARVSPAAAGYSLQPIRAQALEASAGATDFSGLFIGFSLFLIAAAILLVVLLYKFGLEERATEMGVLLALGFAQQSVRRRFLGEGMALAAVGALLGLGGALLYAHGLLVGLRTWWLAAIGTPFLFLHVSWSSMAIGYVATLLLVLLTIWRALQRFYRLPVRALLVAQVQGEHKETRRFARPLVLASWLLALCLSMAAFAVEASAAIPLFFASGACALYGFLASFSLWLRGRQNKSPRSILAMSIGNASRNPSRSALCAALIACAAFVLVAVGANRRVAEDGDPGSGGFALVAAADIPLHQDLNSAEGRFELGVQADVGAARFFALRHLPGEDISCLNLYQPTRPHLLGVSEEFIARGQFQFQQTVELSAAERANPWLLLERDLGPDVVPAIGDFNSVLWILHKGLGDDIVVEDEMGQPVKLRLLGLLHSSLFQSELLVAAEKFQRHFPSRSGYGYFLVETDTAQELAPQLERDLAAYGFDAVETRARLDSYRAVENTYMSTFQMLGGLGLLIGTLGLGLLLLRNALERSGELAALRACGFRRASLGQLLLFENGFLLLVGLSIGSISALVAVAPQLLGPLPLPWLSLASTQLAVLAIGLLSSALAVSVALRRPLLPALKAD